MALIRGEALISMWILIGAALIRRLRLLETRRLIEKYDTEFALGQKNCGGFSLHGQ